MKRQYLTSIALLCIQAFSSGMCTKSKLASAAASGDLDRVSLIATKTGTTLLGSIHIFDAALLQLTETERSPKPYHTGFNALASRCSQEGLANSLYTAVDNLELEKVQSLVTAIHEPCIIACALHDHLMPMEQPNFQEFLHLPIEKLLEVAHTREKKWQEIETMLNKRLHTLSKMNL